MYKESKREAEKKIKEINELEIPTSEKFKLISKLLSDSGYKFTTLEEVKLKANACIDN